MVLLKYDFLKICLCWIIYHTLSGIRYVGITLGMFLLALGITCSKITIKTLWNKVRNMFKVNNKDTRNDTNGVVSGVFIVNFEHISHRALEFLLLTLNM